MSGLEIEDLPVSALPGASGPEYFSSAVPADKDSFFRCRDIEGFAVHLFLGKLHRFGNPLRDRMRGRYRPETAEVSLPPFQASGGSHQIGERLGLMGGVKRDEAHTCLDSFYDLKGQTVRNGLMHDMGPVNQDVRVVQQLIRKTVFRHIHIDISDLEIRILFQISCQRSHNAVGILAADALR